MDQKNRLAFILVIGGLLIIAALVLPKIGPVRRLAAKLQGEKTVEDRLRQYGPAARSRLRDSFEAKGASYPPKRVVLLALKKEKVLQVYAPNDSGRLARIISYPIVAASGESGPKLREGDCQVPEGTYKIVFLNANSLYHLSMRLDYPNSFDRKMAEADNRTNLGGDIMIHGSNVSVGCIAMGDEVSEDLFILAADVGIENVKVVIAPYDFRKGMPVALPQSTSNWTDQLYRNILNEMRKLPG